MESKTPQFDRLLDAILADLVPHVRTCHWADKHPHCQGDFSITTEDIEFLKMLRVPPPNFCPTCRRMRRLTHLNLTRLFSVTCDKESHDENLISVFPKECPFDIWDVDSFAEIDDYYLAQDFNNTLTPYHNLFKLRKNFPMPNFLNREGSVIDSPYSSGGRNLKNGYYVFGCFSSEDVWYTNHTKSARNVMDSRVIKKSEFVYQGFFSSYLYKSTFIYFSKSCSNSMFLYDCRNCTNCFGCVNLRNKSYCIWNVQYTKEEYEKWMQNHIPFTRAFIDETKSRFDIFVKQFTDFPFYQEMAYAAVDKTFAEVLIEEKVPVISRPNISIKEFGESKDVVYEILGDILPEVILPEYKTLHSKYNKSTK
jgi:hypothetical protein